MLIHNIKEELNTKRLHAILSTNGGRVMISADLKFILLEVLRYDWTVSNFKEAMDMYVCSEEYQEHKEIHKQFMLLSEGKSKEDVLTVDAPGRNTFCFLVNVPDDEMHFSIRDEYGDEHSEVCSKKEITVLRDLLDLYLEWQNE